MRWGSTPARPCSRYRPTFPSTVADMSSMPVSHYDPRTCCRTPPRSPDGPTGSADHLQHLPSKTLVIFPSFELMERALVAGLSSALPPGAIIESRRLALGDLWRPVEGIRKKDERAGLILGVAGGRAVEGVDYSEENLEAVVLAGIPFPARSAKREALAAFLDTLAPGEGEIRAFRVPAERAIAQAIGRLIRSEHDRGLLVIMYLRAWNSTDCSREWRTSTIFPNVAARFFGGRAKFYYVTLPTAKGRPAPSRNG